MVATSFVTLALAIFTFTLFVAIWPVGFLIFGTRYKELVVKVLVAELGAGILAYVFHVKASALPPLFLAFSYLAVSSAIGPARGVRLAVNRIAIILIVFMLAAPYFPRSQAALVNLLPKADSGTAAILNGGVPKTENKISVTKVGQTYMVTIVLPTEGWTKWIDPMNPTGMRALAGYNWTISSPDEATHSSGSSSPVEQSVT